MTDKHYKITNNKKKKMHLRLEQLMVVLFTSSFSFLLPFLRLEPQPASLLYLFCQTVSSTVWASVVCSAWLPSECFQNVLEFLNPFHSFFKILHQFNNAVSQLHIITLNICYLIFLNTSPETAFPWWNIKREWNEKWKHIWHCSCHRATKLRTKILSEDKYIPKL